MIMILCYGSTVDEGRDLVANPETEMPSIHDGFIDTLLLIDFVNRSSAKKG
jgi:hypothetical protein